MTAKLYGWLAGLLIVLATVGVIYGKGRIDASHAAEVSRLKTDLATAQVVIATEKAARFNDTLLATEASRRQAVLSQTINGLAEYVETLSDRDSVCLSGDDTERLRNLWDR